MSQVNIIAETADDKTKNKQMNISIPALRLCAHRLADPTAPNTRPINPRETVRYMGAMQAQNFPMAIRAVELRTDGATAEAVITAFNRGDILRTHVLRPTWHFVAPEDIRALLALSAEHIKSAAAARDRALGLTDAIFDYGKNIIAEFLRGGKNLSCDELETVLTAAGIDTTEYRIMHILMRAEIDALICSGPLRGKTQTYALLDERVPANTDSASFERTNTVLDLTRRYFISRGPATVRDFAWWSGQSARDIRTALSVLRSQEEMTEFEKNGRQYYFYSSKYPAAEDTATRHLPAFDEYIIGYSDRSDVLPRDRHADAVSSNGVFRPTILRGGIVVGTWRTTKKDIEETYFS